MELHKLAAQCLFGIDAARAERESRLPELAQRELGIYLRVFNEQYPEGCNGEWAASAVDMPVSIDTSIAAPQSEMRDSGVGNDPTEAGDGRTGPPSARSRSHPAESRT